MASQEDLRASHYGLRASQRGADRRADGRMDEQNFSPFYRILSTVGVAAQKGARRQYGASPHKF